MGEWEASPATRVHGSESVNPRRVLAAHIISYFPRHLYLYLLLKPESATTKSTAAEPSVEPAAAESSHSATQIVAYKVAQKQPARHATHQRKRHASHASVMAPAHTAGTEAPIT